MVNCKNLKFILLSLSVFAVILLNTTFSFATNHYEITTSSSIANETYSDYFQGGNGYGGVFYVGNNGNLTLDNVDFYNNSATIGGAIYFSNRNGNLTLTDVTFTSNTSKFGGAIYNTGTLNISSNVFFSGNKADGDDGQGGAVYNVGAMTIDNVIFSSNTAIRGGALYNIKSSTITNTIFSNNHASYGGAIYGTSDNSRIEIGNGVIFSSNSASGSDSRTGHGGAIYAASYNSVSVIMGDDVIFDSNYASFRGGALFIGSETNWNIGNNVKFTSNKAGSGGVLYNSGGNITIGANALFESNETTTGILNNNISGSITIKGNALFKYNTASNTGAIAYNMGTLTMEDGARFISNVSTQYASGGGAIYNSGILNLIANTNNIEFTGNKNGYSSNAVRNDKTMNLWASDAADIIFNDRITGNNGTININSSTDTLTANGRIILNEYMSGFTGTTNVYGGEVELRSKKQNNSNINTYKFFEGTLNISSGTLNIMNNAIDNIILTTFTLTENANLKFDADLSNNTSDNFTITNTITEGKLNLTGINLLGCNKDVEEGTITLFKNENSPILNVLTTANCGGNIYTFTTGVVVGTLNYAVSGYKTFKEFINDTENEIRSYSFGVVGETVTEDLGDLGGTEFTIFGNGYDLIASSVTGINMSSGQTLNIDNIRDISGFENEGNGGFLYSDKGNINVRNRTSFSSNNADNGGAIYNSLGILTINDNTNFVDNIATSKGGAIYNNKGTIDLIANAGNIVFEGNTANGISNAIHDNNGIMNLWTSENASIIFNDRLTSADSSSIMNINTTTTTVITKGQVILNEDMSGYTGTVNLYGGELLLQSQVEEDSDINTNKLFSGIININNGTLNIMNNAIDNVVVSTLNATENANLKFDVDLRNNTSDNFTVTNVTGIINLTAINLLGVDEDSGKITLFNNEISPELNILTTGAYKGYEYTFTNSDVSGVLNYEKTGLVAKTFKEYVNAEEPETRSYSLSEDEILTTHLFNLGGEQLTIFGNGYDIISDYYNGIYVAEGKTLNVEDVNNYSGFSSNFGAIRNEGTLNISGTKFSNNGGQDIVNNGDLVLSGQTSSFETGIRNYDTSGTTTIDGVDIDLGDTAFIYQESIIINDGGSLKANASNVKGNITNDGTLIFTNGINSNDIRGEGVLKIIGTVSNSKNIIQNIVINDDGCLTANASNVKGNITNDGTLIFTNGTNGNDIHGEGILEIVGNISNSKSIVQKTITIDGSLQNNSVITADDVYINGTFKIGKNGSFYNAINSIINNGSLINLQNNKMQNHNFGKLTVSSGKIDLSIEVDLEKEVMDTISVDSDSEINGTINIRSVNVLKDSKDVTELLLTNSEVLKDKITTSGIAKSKLCKYEVSYDDGYLKFINGNNPLINPAVVEQTVASYVGGFAVQSAIFEQAFMSLNGEVLNSKKNNVESDLYASAGEVFLAENTIKRGLWLRPFVLQDSVKMGVYNVDNSLYGTLAGIDLPILDNILTSFYLGYIGSTQKYDEVNMSQTGYVVGATGMLVKENYYAGLTANMIFDKVSADTDDGTDEFDMNMFSIGAKAGYNFDIGNSWILEPNLMLMYGKSSAQGYETGMGAEIDNQSVSNIVIEPQVKAKWQLNSGWQPYGLIGYIANMNENAKVVADSLEFELDKIDGYVEYGIGANKDFEHTSWSCYGQITGRSGGRSGFAGNFGIKYRF